MPAGVHETKQPLGMVHHLLCQWCLKKIKKNPGSSFPLVCFLPEVTTELSNLKMERWRAQNLAYTNSVLKCN